MKNPIHLFIKEGSLPLGLAVMLCGGLAALNAVGQQTASPAAPAAGQSEAAPARTAKAPAAGEAAKTIQRSWDLLTENVQDTKHTENRIQALNALSSLGTNARADRLIAAAMQDPDLDVRTAAVLAAGKTRARSLVEPVKKLLDDKEPQVVFVAATTLWKQFKDRSGEDLLAAVAAGERKANPTLFNGAKHDMTRTLHSASAMEKIGITTGAGLLLGPFGFSVSAIEYARKNGADTSRIQAIDLLAEAHTEGVRQQMQAALDDKDPGVRAASVRVLGSFHRHDDAALIVFLLDDSKLPVRLSAAAAYIDCLGGAGVRKAVTP